MYLPFGREVIRERRTLVYDPYTEEQTAGDWTNPDQITLEEAFVASSSSVNVTDATRTQLVTAKSLYCDQGADVKAGDRIRVGAEVWSVPAKPEADTNPFTGWQPPQEILLEEVQG